MGDWDTDRRGAFHESRHLLEGWLFNARVWAGGTDSHEVPFRKGLKRLSQFRGFLDWGSASPLPLEAKVGVLEMLWSPNCLGTGSFDRLLLPGLVLVSFRGNWDPIC